MICEPGGSASASHVSKILRHTQTLVVAAFLWIAWDASALAFTCSDEALSRFGETFQCAETLFAYRLDGGFEEVSGLTVHQLDADHNGAEDFSGPPPVAFEDPYFTRSFLSLSAPLGTPAESFSVVHRGNTVFSPTEETSPASIVAGTISDVVFAAIDLSGDTDPVPVSVLYSYEFELLSQFDDETAAEIDGVARYSASGRLKDANGTILTEFFGSTELDAANQTVTNRGDIPLTNIDLRLGKLIASGSYFDAFDVFNDNSEPFPNRLETESSAFGDIVSIIPGRILRFGVAYRFSYEVEVSSTDPDVRFLVVPEPSTGALFAGMALIVLAGAGFTGRVGFFRILPSRVAAPAVRRRTEAVSSRGKARD